MITLKDPVCWKGSYEELDDAYETIGKYDELIFALQNVPEGKTNHQAILDLIKKENTLNV